MKKDQKKVLVIDDDLGMVRLLEKRLGAQNYAVTGAHNGGEGIKKAKQLVPDLILLDVMMPDLLGADVLRKLKKDSVTKNIPVIFITVTISKKDDKVQKELEIDGVSYYAFAKPLYFPKLLSIIRKSINPPAPKSKSNV